MKKFGRAFKVSVGISTFLTVWIFVAPMFAENLIVEKKLEKAEAILILGGSSVYVERAQKGAELYKTGVAPKIFLTDDGGRAGWSQSERKNPRFVELARGVLLAEGVPPENIEILEPAVSGTIDEAELLRKTFEERKFKTILLVTSAYHTRRSLWTFEKIFAETDVEIGIESAPPGVQTPPPAYWWLSEIGWRLVAGEYLKAVYYWAKY